MSNISDPHIKNFYEDLNFEVDDIESIINDAFSGKLCNATEKVDGQNFTFTVVDGVVRFMGKGSAKWIREKGGLNKQEMFDHLKGKGNIDVIFASAYDAIQSLVEKAPIDLVTELFENGGCVLQADIISSTSRNIVIYKVDKIISLTCAYKPGTVVRSNFKQDKIKKLLDVAQVIENFYGWTFIGIKHVEFKPHEDIFKDLNSCINEYALIRKSYSDRTVGECLIKNGIDVLRALMPYEPSFNYEKIAKRIITESAADANLKSFSKSTARVISDIEKRRAYFMRLASAQLIRSTTKISNLMLKCYDFSLSDVNHDLTFVKMLNSITDCEFRIQDKKIVDDMRSITNVFSVNDYVLNTEGIVFEWKDIPRKLTGGFTGVNKIQGLLIYSK